jgi:addiction module RelE/StbE family toxin
MTIAYGKSFKKQYGKLPSKLQLKFDERVKLFAVNSYDPILNNHALTGKYFGYNSINITGDLRALYYKEAETIVIFGFIGTHSQLYR